MGCLPSRDVEDKCQNCRENADQQRWTLALQTTRLANLSKSDMENIQVVWDMCAEKDIKITIIVEMFRTVLCAYPQMINKLPIVLAKSRFAYDWKWYADSKFVEFTKKIVKWLDDFIGSLDQGKDVINYQIDVLANIHEPYCHQSTNHFKIGVESIDDSLVKMLPAYAKNPKLQESWRILLKTIFYGLCHRGMGRTQVFKHIYKRPFILCRRQRLSFAFPLDEKKTTLSQKDIITSQKTWADVFKHGQGKEVSTVFLQEFFGTYPHYFDHIFIEQQNILFDANSSWCEDPHTLMWNATLMGWLDALFAHLGNKEALVAHIETFEKVVGLDTIFLKAIVHILGNSYLQLSPAEELPTLDGDNVKARAWHYCLKYIFYLVDNKCPTV